LILDWIFVKIVSRTEQSHSFDFDMTESTMPSLWFINLELVVTVIAILLLAVVDSLIDTFT
jgi:hypothetical protein